MILEFLKKEQREAFEKNDNARVEKIEELIQEVKSMKASLNLCLDCLEEARIRAASAKGMLGE